MNSPEDSRLRTRFANLREEDRSAAPPFGRDGSPRSCVFAPRLVLADCSCRDTSSRHRRGACRANPPLNGCGPARTRRLVFADRVSSGNSRQTTSESDTKARRTADPSPTGRPGWTQMKPMILILLLFSSARRAATS